MKRYTDYILKKLIILFLMLTLMLPILHPFKVKAYETLSKASWFDGSIFDVIFKETTLDLELNTYINDLYIYSYDTYKDYSGEIKNTSISYKLSGISNKNIYVGNTDSNYAKQKDIKIYFENITISEGKSINIYPVYNNSAYYVDIINDKESSISNFILEEKAIVNIKLNEDLIISTLNLGANSILNIDLNGNNLNIGSLNSGVGTLNISGEGTVEGTNDINVGYLNVDGSTLIASNVYSTYDMKFINNATISTKNALSGQISSNGNITVNNSIVKNAVLFGYKSDANGLKTFTLESASFSDINIVGATNETNAIVIFAGSSMVSSSSNTSYSCDYPITYKYNDNIIQNDSFPTHYRVKYTGALANEPQVLGTTKNGVFTNGDRMLPSYTVDGYAYSGWILENTSNKITTLSNESGALVLNASLIAGGVVAYLNLGYIPTEYTNDLPLPSWETIEQYEVDDTITLTKPFRFGYVFNGWEIKTGSGRILDPNTTNLKINLDDMDLLDSSTYELRLEATWSKLSFPVRFYLGAEVPTNNIEISVDGGNSWTLISTFASNNSDKMTLDSSNGNIIFKHDFIYGISLGAYFESNFGWQFPLIRDNRSGDVQKRFVCWETSSLIALNKDIKYDLNGGFINVPNNTKLSDYQEILNVNPIVIRSKWGTMEFTITSPSVTGWDVLVNGNKINLSNGNVVVPVGSTISWRTRYSEALNFSLWKITYREDGTGIEKSLNVKERTYISGEYIYYDFIMPTADVNATYTASGIYIDLSISDIIFTNTVSFNYNTARSGFWYKVDLSNSLMSPLFAKLKNGNYSNDWSNISSSDIDLYFYEFDISKPVYITTNNVKTQNQLILVKNMSVYLKNCYMVTRESYQNDFNGNQYKNNFISYHTTVPSNSSFKDKHVANLLKEVDLSLYGNIIIKNTEINNTSEFTYIYIDGNNIVGTIFSSTGYYTSTNKTKLSIKGNTGVNDDNLYLGCCFGIFDVEFNDLTIRDYSDREITYKDNFNYLIYIYNATSQDGTVSFTNVTANLPNKDFHTAYGYFKYNKNAIITVRNTTHAYYTQLNSSSAKVHILGNLYGYHYLLQINSGSLTIEGFALSSGYSSGGFYMYGGVLICKGYALEINNIHFTGGTIIANAVIIGSSAAHHSTSTVNGMANPRLITNQVINSPHLRPVANINTGELVYTNKNYTKEIFDYGDCDLFLNYFQPGSTSGSSNHGYTFFKTKFYLTGYYKINGTQKINGKTYNLYDKTIKVTDNDNPLKEVVEKIVDNTGNYNGKISLLTDSYLKEIVLKASLKYSDSECWLAGNTSYNVQGSSNYRAVNFSANCEIYAAGNLTFYNDVIFTNTNVVCYGNLSSKNNITFNSGTFVVNEIGNIYNLTNTLSDNTISYKTTIINGGTFTVNRIGAISKSPYNVESFSALFINSNATFTQNTQVIHDLYINYMFDSTSFDVPASNHQSLRFVGYLSTTKNTLDKIDLNLVSNIETLELATSNIILNLPIVKADGTYGSWRLEQQSGNEIDTITINGLFKNNDLTIDNIGNYSRIALYATKIYYDAIVKEGSEFISKIYVDGENLNLNGSKAKIHYNSNVEILLNNASMAEKTIVWYFDASNVLHNVQPQVNGNVVSFIMPVSNTEIYITNKITLYIDLYEIALTDYGFRTTYNESVEELDKEFNYKGDIEIKQSNITATKYFTNANYYHSIREISEKQANSNPSPYSTQNRLLFDSNSGQVCDLNGNIRKVILNQIILTNSAENVTIDGNNEEVSIYISGAVGVSKILVNGNTKLSIIGFNGSETDVFSASTLSDRNFIYVKGKGTITYDNLKLLVTMNGYLVQFSTRESTKTIIRNVVITSTQWYYYNALAYNCNDVLIENSSINLKTLNSTANSLFLNCNYGTIKDSNVYFESGGTTAQHSVFWGLYKTLTIDNSIVTQIYKNSYDNVTYGISPDMNDFPLEVTIKNNSNVNVQQRIMFHKLTIDNATLTMNNSNNNPSFLFSKEILIQNNGTINSDYIVVSGYYMPPSSSYEGSKEQFFINNVENNNHIIDGSASSKYGLVLNSGTLNVTEFIGGDINSKITINGGTVNTNKMGTIGYIFGYTNYLPKTTEKFVYTYEKMVSSDTIAKININGGTINISNNGYIGGLYSEINISNGIVNLGDHSIVGVNSVQQAKVEVYEDTLGNIPSNLATLNVSGGTIKANGLLNNGSISLPYSSGLISGINSSINVYNFTAHKGSITFSGGNNYNLVDLYYDNPYVAMLRSNDHTEVRYLISNTLTAQTLKIIDEAVVYANSAYTMVELNEIGSFNVENDGLSTIYVNSTFGALGEGTNTLNGYTENTAENNNLKNIYGIKTVYIKYIIDDIYNIIEDNHLNNVINNSSLYYTVGQKNSSNEYYLELLDASCFGYIFEGWYSNEECTGDAITHILTTNHDDITLYAKWKKVVVNFSITIDNDVLKENFVEELSNQQGIFDSNKNNFTYEYIQSISYYESLLGNIDLSKYCMESYQAVDITLKDSYYNNGNETIINSDFIINDELLMAYLNKVEDNDENSTIILRISNIINTRNKITFNLNLDSNNRPVNAKFNFGNVKPNEGLNEIYFYVDLGNIIGSNESSLALNGELIYASAPGYEFAGWYDNKECTGNYITKEYQINATSSTIFYAKWKPVEYTVRFDAGVGGVVTPNNIIPTGTENQTLDANILYDEVIDGSLDINSTANSDLPFAWKDGFMFKHWVYTINGIDYILDDEEFNLNDITNLNIDNDISITFKAVYKEVEVTYNPIGGIWKDYSTNSVGSSNNITVHDDYNKPLLGYTLNENNVEIISTSASDFKINGNSYNANDYREDIKRTGYTFLGWFDEFDNEVKTFPRYNDLTLYAKWQANTYNLILNSKDSNYNYQYTSFYDDYGDGKVPVATVTVGNVIEGNFVINWPSRDTSNTNAWYAYNSDLTGNITEDNKRFLLGFTFDPLNPGSTDGAGRDLYEIYANQITNLYNQGFIFHKKEGSLEGSLFKLPESFEYGNSVIAGTNEVPDYPSGYLINMYAVYREISIVFIERIVVDDKVNETVMHSAPWSNYSTYPNSYIKTTNVPNGYTLVGWYVNGYDINGFVKYPTNSQEYDNLKTSFKEAAKSNGTYDINVYTIYAAQVTEKNKGLTADYNPINTGTSYYQYKLPNSMLDGHLTYSLSNKTSGFNIVPLRSLDYYNSSLANNTIAIVVGLYKDGIKAYEFDLNESGLDTSNYKIGAGWEIRFTLYHSKIMSETITHKFDITFMFEGIDSQFIKFEEFSINIQPSIYNVHYNANLPNYSFLNVLEYNGFNQDKSNSIKTITLGYNQLLYGASDIPVIEGFTADGKWYLTDNSGIEINNQYIIFDNNFSFDISLFVTDNNYPQDIYLKTNWTIDEYNFSSTTNVRNEWTILNNSLEITTGLTTITYHNVLTFKAISNGNHPEFILIKINGEIKRLSEFGDKTSEGIYIFYMPSSDIEAVYEDTVTLFLDEGTISINEFEYSQNGNTIIWPGGYIILMDNDNMSDGEITYNTLNLSGDLSSRTINLGNLFIGTNDSIKLYDNSVVNFNLNYDNLESSIDILNIDVPHSSNLTINNEIVSKANIKIRPNVNYSGIGSYNDSGVITINNVNLEAFVTAPSKASVIGSNNVSGKSKDIIINDTNILVHEYSTPSAAYAGIWVGAKVCDEITLNNVNINVTSDSSKMSGPFIMLANIINIESSILGSNIYPLLDPIYAVNELNIVNSEIYQRIASLLPNSTKAIISTSDTGVINVTNSIIKADVAITDIPMMYNGKLYINDALSSVVIFDYQIVDTNNGNIVINDSSVTQNNITHNHISDYYIINSFNSNADLTVLSLKSNSEIFTTDVNLSNIVINNDAKIKLMGKLITDNVLIEDDVTLYITTDDDNNEICFNSNKPFSTETTGKYIQENGKITNNNLAKVEIGNKYVSIELVNVIANIHSIFANNLVINNSIINANTTNGKVGSYGIDLSTPTNVEIIGSTNIVAKEIGALGNHCESFTFVNIENLSIFNYTGTLYQDWYRIAYEFNDSNFDLSNLPVVFRTSSLNGGEQISMPSIPNDPTYMGIGSSYFSNWYFIGENGDYIAISTSNIEGFLLTVNGLIVSYSKYAIDNNDGTKTLTLHAWLLIRGNGTITSGRLFEEFTDTLDFISIYSDYSWSSLFNVEGALVDGSDYQLVFGKKLPIGTKLTLVVFEEDNIKYYYYNVTNEINKILISTFIKMGTNNINPDLLKGIAGTKIKDKFIVSVDFSNVENMSSFNNIEVSVILQLIFGSTIFDISSVSYKTIDVPNADIDIIDTTGEVEEIEGEITIKLPNDERKVGNEVVVIAELQNEKYEMFENVSYDSEAYLTFNNNTYKGVWLSDNMVAFKIGIFEYNTLLTLNCTYSILGINPGIYNLTWNVALTNYGTNALNDVILSESTINSIEVKEHVIEPVNVVIKTVNGKEINNNIFVNEDSFELLFESEIDANKLTAQIQIICSDGNIYTKNIDITVDDSSLYQFTLIVNINELQLPESINGIYNIILSSDGFADSSIQSDDYCYKFIILK